jgi:hypothetical protein
MLLADTVVMAYRSFDTLPLGVGLATILQLVPS